MYTGRGEFSYISIHYQWGVASNCFFYSSACQPRYPGTPDALIGNFAEHEFIIAVIGLAIGLVTAILASLDYSWYTEIVAVFNRIGTKWREIFPKHEHTMKTLNTKSPVAYDNATILQELKKK